MQCKYRIKVRGDASPLFYYRLMIASMNVEAEVKQLVEDIISNDPSLFLVDVKLKGNQSNQRLIILLDGDEGVTIDQCSNVSRSLSGLLEEKDLIDGKYYLEVSSAGIDFPLQMVRQYQKNKGRSLKVTLKNGSKLEGELKEVQNGLIVLEEKKNKKEVVQHSIPMEEIDKSIVLVSFK